MDLWTLVGKRGKWGKEMGKKVEEIGKSEGKQRAHALISFQQTHRKASTFLFCFFFFFVPLCAGHCQLNHVPAAPPRAVYAARLLI